MIPRKPGEDAVEWAHRCAEIAGREAGVQLHRHANNVAEYEANMDPEWRRCHERSRINRSKNTAQL